MPQYPAFEEGPIDGLLVSPLRAHTDARGWLIELFRADELPADNVPAMAYVSETLPGVARGPHEHVDQDDFFAFFGPGDLTLYCWDARRDSPTYGHKAKMPVGQLHAVRVIVPKGVVHGYRNSGYVPAWVFNAPNRLYAGPGKREPVDEIRHEEAAGSPYQMDW